MPIIKKITIIRIFALKINNTTLKIINPEPTIKSQSGVEEVILTHYQIMVPLKMLS